MRIIAVVLTVALLSASNAAHAKPPQEQYCSLIKSTDDGRFKTEIQPGWTLWREQQMDGQIVYDADVVGVTCLRTPITLVVEDAETLRQGKSLNFADATKKDMTIVKYELVDGTITYSVQIGALSKGDIKKVEQSIKIVQAAL
jgi:hypothetical protein